MGPASAHHKRAYLIHLGWIFVAMYSAFNFGTVAQELESDDSSASLIKSPSSTPMPYFNVEQITMGPFFSMSSTIPLDVCPASEVSYGLIVPMEAGAMRVPHSTIRMNGLKCGPLPDDATIQELWMDNYMELTPITHLMSSSIAQQHGVLGIYNRIFTLRVFTQALYKSTIDAMEANLTRPMVFVGLERHTSRICGNGSKMIILPYNTFVFIGMFDQITDFATFVPYDDSVPLRAKTPFHISFREGDPNSLTEPEIACPYHRPTPTSTPRPPNIRMCVPANAILTVVGGGSLPIYQAQVGDFVLDKSNRPSPIIAFTHRDQHSVAKYISLHVQGTNGENQSLDVSAGHYIFVVEKRHDTIEKRTVFRSADEVGVGDVVLTSQGVGSIVLIEEVWRNGIYNVHTSSGSVIINGIAISCYTTAVPLYTAHSLLTPVRFFMLFFSPNFLNNLSLFTVPNVMGWRLQIESTLKQMYGLA